MKTIILIISVILFILGFDFKNNQTFNQKIVTITTKNDLIYHTFLGEKNPMQNTPKYSNLRIKTNEIGEIKIVFLNYETNENLIIEGNVKKQSKNTLIVGKNSEILIKNIPYIKGKCIEVKIYLYSFKGEKINNTAFFDLEEFCGTELFPKKHAIPDILLERLRIRVKYDEKVIISEKIIEQSENTQITYRNGIAPEVLRYKTIWNRMNISALAEDSHIVNYSWRKEVEDVMNKQLYFFAKNSRVKVSEIYRGQSSLEVSRESLVEIPIKIWIKEEFNSNLRTTPPYTGTEQLGDWFIQELDEPISVAIVRHDILRANQLFEGFKVGVKLILDTNGIVNTTDDIELNNNSSFDNNAINFVYVSTRNSCNNFDSVQMVCGSNTPIGFTFCNTSSIPTDCNNSCICSDANFKNNGWISSIANNETLAHELGHVFALSHGLDEANLMHGSSLYRDSISLGQSFKMNFFSNSFLNRFRINISDIIPSIVNYEYDTECCPDELF